MATSSDKPKRFRLSLVNAAEDVPRLVRAYGRACMGEFALVLRPRERRGVLVLMTKKDGARVWKAGEGDAPGVPEALVSPEDAVKLVKVEQKALPKAGPITLRGQWSGYLYCEEGAPRVELQRKLATYGVLHVVSVAGGGWTWKVERTEKWFSEPGADEGEATTLLKAIEAGLARAMGLLGEACSLRDSRRRTAYDSVWAESHPIRPAREGKDPTERLKVRASRRATEAPPPAPIDAPLSLPDVPATPAAMQRMEQEVTAEADALAELRGLPWVWADSGVREEVAAWFGERGLEHLGAQVRAYEGGPDQPLDAFLAGLEEDVRAEGLAAADQRQALDQVARLRAGWMEAPQLMERARRLIRYAARMADSKLCRGKEKREAVEAVQRAVEAYDEARTAIAEERAVDGLRTLRRIGERVALSAAKAARSCATGQQSLTAAGTVGRPAAPVAKGSEPELTVVSLGATPRTVDELRAITAGHLGAFEQDPKASTAKRWVKSALLHLGLEAVNVSAKTRSFADLGGGKRVFVSLVLPASAEGEETEAKLRLLSSSAPRGLSIEDWNYEGAGARRLARTTAGSGPRASTSAPPVPPNEADPEKDKALLDAFSAAIAAAMAGA